MDKWIAVLERTARQLAVLQETSSLPSHQLASHVPGRVGETLEAEGAWAARFRGAGSWFRPNRQGRLDAHETVRGELRSETRPWETMES